MTDHTCVWTVTVVDETSTRAAEWLVVHGSLTVRIESPLPEMTVMAGLGVVRVFKLDVASLSAAERERLVTQTARRFGLSEADVASDVAGEHGVPLLARGLRVEGCCGHLRRSPRGMETFGRGAFQ